MAVQFNVLLLLIVACSAHLTLAKLFTITSGKVDDDGKRMIVIMESLDMHIVCESPVEEQEVKWVINGAQLTEEPGKTEMMTKNVTVGGVDKAHHTLIIRKIAPNERGTYTCGPEMDVLQEDTSEIDVKVFKREKLAITEAGSTSSLRVKKVNGTYDDLTLTCVGHYRSNPAFLHDGEKVEESVGTILLTEAKRDEEQRRYMMTRENVTERFAGRYQCIDANYYQANSDMLTVRIGTAAAAAVTVSGALVMAGLLVSVLTNNRL